MNIKGWQQALDKSKVLLEPHFDKVFEEEGTKRVRRAFIKGGPKECKLDH